MKVDQPIDLRIQTRERPIQEESSCRRIDLESQLDVDPPAQIGVLRVTRLFVAVWLASFATIYTSGLLFRQPGYMDAYYYYHVASNLAKGQGFVENFVWNYLYLPDAVIHPSNLHWMPLTSVVVAPFFSLLGESFRSAQLPVVIASSLLPAVTFAIGMKVFGNLRQSMVAAVLTVFSGYYFIHWSAIDAFGIFGLSVTLVLVSLCSLIVSTRASRKRQTILAVLVGFFAALSHLARADGVLLLPVAGIVLASGHLLLAPAKDCSIIERLRLRRTFLLFSIILLSYLATMLPWFMHNQQVIGSPLPLGGSQSMFLREYNEFYSYERDLTLQTYLDWGIGPIVLSKLEVMGRNLIVFLGMEHYLLPFIAVGLWSLRRNSWYLPFAVYAIMLYLFMSLIFTFPASRGSMLHSSVALIPWLTMAAARGIDVIIEAIARRRKHWNVPKAKRNFGIIFVSFSMLFSLVVIFQSAAERDASYSTYKRLADWFSERDPAALIMVDDPPGYYYVSNRPSIVVPNESPEVVVRAARRYGATYVMLEKAHSRYLDALYKGEEASPLLEKLDEFDGIQIFRIRDEY